MAKRKKATPTDNTVEKQSTEVKPWQFKPGQSGNPAGRPKGIKNEIQRSFLLKVQEKFNAKGDQVLDTMIEKAPARFVELVGRLMPQEHSWDEEQAESFVEVLRHLGRASKSKDE